MVYCLSRAEWFRYNEENVMQTVFYEWAVETIDEFSNIEDVDHFDTYAEVLQFIEQNEPEPGYEYRVALTRLRYSPDDRDQLVERSYAYMDDGALPREFEDGDMCRVPAKFHKEVSA